jgi:hypothetical protein
MDSPTAESLLTLAEESSAASVGADAKAALDRLDGEYDELLWSMNHCIALALADSS